jgi:restriction endonuclease S subunit
MDYFNLHGTGTYIPFISAAVLKEMPLLIPGAEKQRKISELDGYINKERELVKNLGELKSEMYKGILAKVLSGGEIE